MSVSGGGLGEESSGFVLDIFFLAAVGVADQGFKGKGLFNRNRQNLPAPLLSGGVYVACSGARFARSEKRQRSK